MPLWSLPPRCGEGPRSLQAVEQTGLALRPDLRGLNHPTHQLPTLASPQAPSGCKGLLCCESGMGPGTGHT